MKILFIFNHEPYFAPEIKATMNDLADWAGLFHAKLQR